MKICNLLIEIRNNFKILNFKCSVYRDIGQNVEDGKGPVVSARESGRRANGCQGTQPSTDEPILDQASKFQITFHDF